MGLYTRNKECYLMSVPSGYVKVGISDDPKRRVKEVQSYCYEPVRYEWSTECSRGAPVSAETMEQMVHMKLAAFCARRKEWFKTDPETATNVMLTTYWFLAIPPDHKDIERVHPDIDCHFRRWRSQEDKDRIARIRRTSRDPEAIQLCDWLDELAARADALKRRVHLRRRAEKKAEDGQS
mgnify:CR=1 FL=1